MILQVDVIIECDECGEEERYDLDSMSEVALENVMKADGWEKTSSPHGLAYRCPACIADVDEDEE